MIIKDIEMYNFGAYLGHHHVDLSPTEKRPVILIGALNGSGKTTLLDALKLALYGKFADCSTRGSHSYTEFLKSCINRNSSDKSASVSINLSVSKNLNLRVKRAWKNSGTNAGEEVAVWVNDIESPETAERWYEYVGNIAPYEISSLFFYDGEMIEEISSKQSSSEIIKKGLHSLLGLDLVTSLANDLQIIGRKKKSELLDIEESELHNEIESKIAALEKLLVDLSHEIERVEEEIRSEKIQLRNRQQKYEINGGDLVSQKIILDNNLRKIQADIQSLIEDRIAEESGLLPLAMVSSLVSDSITEAKNETSSSTRKLIRSSMELLRDELLKRVKSDQPDLHDHFRSMLDETVNNVAPDVDALDLLTNREVDIKAVAAFQENGITDSQARAMTINSRIQTLRNDELAIQSSLNAIPDPETVAYLVNEIDQKKSELSKLEFMHETALSAFQTKSRELDELRAQRESSLNKAISEKFANQKERSAIEQIGAFSSILDKFKKESTANHLTRIETLIKESLDTIMRKSDFVNSVQVSPETYELSLISENGTSIDTTRLSAGERQLLATSILWSLSKAAKHDMPTVIDTPLGRLDGKHRTKLVKNYFSHAGKQVILLSTDEEIIGKYLTLLEDSIAKKYTISYKENLTSSVVSPGYFAEEVTA